MFLNTRKGIAVTVFLLVFIYGSDIHQLFTYSSLFLEISTVVIVFFFFFFFFITHVISAMVFTKILKRNVYVST